MTDERIIDLAERRATPGEIEEFDPREDMLATCSRMETQIRNGTLAGLVVIPISCEGGRMRYSLGLSGWAATNPTFALGALESAALLVSELSLKEAGIL